MVWLIARFVRSRRRRAADFFALLLSVAAVFGIYAIWFELSWGWNYTRPPLEARIRFDPSRVNANNATALRTEAMRQLNSWRRPRTPRRTTSTSRNCARRGCPSCVVPGTGGFRKRARQNRRSPRHS